jgi:hypothetical protein
MRVLLLALLATLSGCIYHFTGGGLPSNVNTVAILPFENQTSQPLLDTDIQRALQTAFPRNLGVRLADQATADAVVRGKVTRYEEVPASYRPTQPGQDEVPVIQRQVRITYDAEIYDVKQDKPLWRGQAQTVIGNYQPDSQTESDGRANAIKDLVNKVIEGAQSQW